MKKLICLILLTAFAVTGCGADPNLHVFNTETGLTRPVVVTETTIAPETSDTTPTAVSSEVITSSAPVSDTQASETASGGIDIDLTTLSATMVYSEVFNIMLDPDSYIGKTIKMEGLFASFYDVNQDKYYFACIIQDATQCCSQGIEFVPTEEFTYPEDFPAEGEMICVTGVFSTYEVDGNEYLTLKDAVISS
ncbi:MAG: hypothetical protein K5745_04460 [Saccharofermentans sp.]|nr:hypothetical protein [Saccharofermentans sp.]